MSTPIYGRLLSYVSTKLALKAEESSFQRYDEPLRTQCATARTAIASNSDVEYQVRQELPAPIYWDKGLASLLHAQEHRLKQYGIHPSLALH